jgi:hypothetical protein
VPRIPPERFHAFVSYATREDEVREIKPFIYYFLNVVLRPSIERTLGEPPVFYDGYYLKQILRRRIPLKSVLRYAVEESELLLASEPEQFPLSGL